MTGVPTDDQPGFVAEKPERCFTCFRLIRPGQTYYLTIEQEVLCADYAILISLVRDAANYCRKLHAGGDDCFAYEKLL